MYMLQRLIDLRWLMMYHVIRADSEYAWIIWIGVDKIYGTNGLDSSEPSGAMKTVYWLKMNYSDCVHGVREHYCGSIMHLCFFGQQWLCGAQDTQAITCRVDSLLTLGFWWDNPLK